MSVKLETKKDSSYGHLELSSMESMIGATEYVMRMRAMISYLKAADPERIDEDDRYFMLCLLEDHFPTEEQAERFLRPSPH